MQRRASSWNGAVMAFVGQAVMQREQEPQRFFSGASGANFFTEDRLVTTILKQRLPGTEREAALKALTDFGETCGGELGQLIEAAHQDGKYPRLERFDRWGHRIDRIVYCEEQLQARRLAFEHGLLPPKPLLSA